VDSKKKGNIALQHGSIIHWHFNVMGAMVTAK
jgi:hypothetical protein